MGRKFRGNFPSPDGAARIYASSSVGALILNVTVLYMGVIPGTRSLSQAVTKQIGL